MDRHHNGRNLVKVALLAALPWTFGATVVSCIPQSAGVHTTNRPGRFNTIAPPVDELPGSEEYCGSDLAALRTAANLRQGLTLWLAQRLPDGTPVQSGGVSTTVIPNAWFIRWYPPGTVRSWLVTAPGTTPGFRRLWIQAYGQVGDCSWWSTTPCHYVELRPRWWAGNRYEIRSGWAIYAGPHAGTSCENRWDAETVACALVGGEDARDCWLPDELPGTLELVG